MSDKETLGLKTPPHSIEAEQSILGGLLLDNSKWDVVGDKVIEDDFYRQDHRLLFRVVSRLATQGNPIDVITVSEELQRLGELENAGGMAYLTELVEKTPSASNVRSYSNIVHERAVLRRLIQISGEISDSAFNPTGRSTNELLDEAERKVFQISESSAGQETGPVSVNPVLTKTLERIEELFDAPDGITGVTTGFKDLDDMTSGLQSSDLVIVAARPSMGKTAFAMNLVESALIKAEVPVLVFSMEMPADSILMRMLSSLGQINQTKVRSGKLDEEDWPRLSSAAKILKDRPLFIDDTAGLSPTEVRSRARRVAREVGQIGMIMVDYLQLMQIPGMNEGRTAEISEISRSLKALAKELQCPVVALSQLNRGLESRTDKRPMNSDLRESGAIEQDADVIMFIYRDEYYNEESPDKGIAEIIIGKQRNGPIGKVKLQFQGQFTKFNDLAHVDYNNEF
ncbi:replicative DNA helicase [Oleiphilus sp. HI0071]|nr:MULTISPECIES: replicative DNA helicase [unclassified Oleiphilus]KZY60932.1 replicative DNA helicase [Oleiphilus sp. HI0065]KZY82827.1 replicative DNA helicase [Oleiphilus sp. HI0071]KZZ04860.1 replicative DNA helicase [Oleiphilus sp. HI0073]KZZ43836.1 replicative DNA helicase [Oleiphilus sp. HI0118]KZZ56674.1 replicative DNA helicase [Oleiphilus sp. HI0122]KZZ65602.1 replicative DNA helicase [Oleiphilus sp. HI0130]KZZ81250.1 replicative DNA helicase [Oleiphilus sp. HI0133]